MGLLLEGLLRVLIRWRGEGAVMKKLWTGLILVTLWNILVAILKENIFIRMEIRIKVQVIPETVCIHCLGVSH